MATGWNWRPRRSSGGRSPGSCVTAACPLLHRARREVLPRGAGQRDEDLEKLTQYIALAAEIGITHIRVFGDPIPNAGEGMRQRNYKIQSEYLACAAERAAHAGVQLVLETHMNFRALDAAEVLYLAGYPADCGSTGTWATACGTARTSMRRTAT